MLSMRGRELFCTSTDGLVSLKERGEDKPRLRAEEGIMAIAAFPLGYTCRIEHPQRDLSQIMCLDFRWDLQLWVHGVQ